MMGQRAINWKQIYVMGIAQYNGKENGNYYVLCASYGIMEKKMELGLYGELSPEGAWNPNRGSTKPTVL